MRETLILVCFIILTGLYFYYTGDDDPNRATYKVPHSASVKLAPPPYDPPYPAPRETPDHSMPPQPSVQDYSERVLDEYSDEPPEFTGDFPPPPIAADNVIEHNSAQRGKQSYALDKVYMPGDRVDQFIITINDKSYDRSQTIYTQAPVYAWFMHPDPRVTHIRMEYPRNTSMYIDYPVNEKVRIQIHESYLQAGDLSFSDFIARDSTGREFGRIRLTFSP